MIALIITLILCGIIILVSFYDYKQRLWATEEMKQVEAAKKRLSSLRNPPFTYCMAIDLDKSSVIVGGKYRYDGFFYDANFKEFPFDPTDAEDRAFAIREAEELIEKLKER